MLAAASGSTSPTSSTDQEEVDPLPDREIPSNSIAYLGDFPEVPVTTDSSRNNVIVNGLLLDNSRVAMANKTIYVFATSSSVYFCSFESGCESYIYSKTNTSFSSTISLSSLNSSTGIYYFNNNSLGVPASYIPTYSSLQVGLDALKAAYDELQADPDEPPPADILGAIQRTNDLLSGLVFFVGFSCGISSMRELWRRL